LLRADILQLSKLAATFVRMHSKLSQASNFSAFFMHRWMSVQTVGLRVHYHGHGVADYVHSSIESGAASRVAP
jgi:hypothetical protein